MSADSTEFKYRNLIFQTEEYYPTSVPSLKFAEICSKPAIKRGIIDIANILESVVLFSAPWGDLRLLLDDVTVLWWRHHVKTVVQDVNTW